MINISRCLSEGNRRNICVFSTYTGCKCILFALRGLLKTSICNENANMFPFIQKALRHNVSSSSNHKKNATTKRLATSMLPNLGEREGTLIWLARLESLKSPGNVSKIIKEAVSFIKPWSKAFSTYCAFFIVSSGAKCLHLHNIIGFMGVL